jgi:SAM-dependent methyltransferase
MSESTDDAQLATAEEVVPPAADAPTKSRQPSEADDVEVMAQAPEPPPAARHDSAIPTSRKLAPPPKPKRDSNNPGSMPPPASEQAVSAGGLKLPSAPGISFQDASTSSREAVAAALSGTESLRAIGETLAQGAGASSTAETPASVRPPVPRPRSQPSISINPPAPGSVVERPPSFTNEPALTSEPLRARDKLPTVPDFHGSSPRASGVKPGSVAPQRIIAIGGSRAEKAPSAASPPAPQAPQAPQPAARLSPAPPPLTLDLDRTLEAAPVIEHVQTAQPPPVMLAPAPAPAKPVSPEVPPPPLELLPSPPDVPPLPPLPSVSTKPAAAEPSLPIVVAPPVLAAAPLVVAPFLAELDESSEISVDVHVEDPPSDIPITTDFEEDTPTVMQTILPADTPLPPPLAAALSPREPAPAPPPGTAVAAVTARAEPLAAEDVTPDSAEELSREDSPSLPPEEPTPAPPPAPSARAEAKPPPPPKRAPAPPVSEPTAAEGEKKKSKQKRAWWEELFSEDFVRANWKVSDEQIKREVTFVEESLGVAPGGVVLDLGCGSGQHAVELASRGYGVVGYDLSLYQLALAADNAQERSQKLNFLQGDMREMAFEEMFDGIFCWNTSFGYFEEDKNYSVAERAFRALRPGGMFLVDVMNRDFVAAHTPSSVWFEGDSCVCMDDAVIDYFTSRLRVKRSVILDDGRTRECTYSVRLYSFHELGKLLHEVGFRVTEVSGHPATPGVFLGQASPRILMLAQRP